MPTGTLELFLSGVWTAVPLYSGPGSRVTRGHDPDGSWPRPVKIECEIADDAYAYDPARPESQLYGIAGRNTRARYRVNGTTRVWAESSSWRPDRTAEHTPGVRGRSWVNLTAEGVLRRIGLWTDPIRSPMFRTISGRSTSLGHWPLEDAAGSTVLINTYPGGRPGTLRAVTLGESEAPSGAASTVRMGPAGSQVAGRFRTASTTAGWQLDVSYRLSAIPASATYVEITRWTATNGYLWQFMANNVNYRILVTDAAGTTLLDGAVTFGTGAEPDKWITMRWRAVQNGGNVDVQPWWYRQDFNVQYLFNWSFAGTVGALSAWSINGEAGLDGAHYAHVFAVTGITDDLASWSNMAVFNGYNTESGWDRFARLCAEVGITQYRIGTSADTQAMGPQRRQATFLELLSDIRDTDDCRIDDERFDIALTLRTRRAMYNQTAALTLAFLTDVAVPFTRILDDLNTHNRVTLKNYPGGEITSSRDTGPMSTLAPPAGVGEYKQSIDVNAADPSVQLANMADWRRARGTLARARYAELTVDLLADPGLATAAMAVREGDRITVTGAEPEAVELMVVGLHERIGAVEWTITYQTEPYDVWIIGKYDDGIWRWDTATTTLAAGATSTATTLNLSTADPDDVLTRAAASLPYDLMVGGERVRVTAMTAPAGTGGAPRTQTATVTRSINGVIKAQTAGTEVHVYTARRWGL